MHCPNPESVSNNLLKNGDLLYNKPNLFSSFLTVQDGFIEKALTTIDICVVINYLCEITCEEIDVVSPVRVASLIHFDDTHLCDEFRNSRCVDGRDSNIYKPAEFLCVNLADKNGHIETSLEVFLLMSDVLQNVIESEVPISRIAEFKGDSPSRISKNTNNLEGFTKNFPFVSSPFELNSYASSPSTHETGFCEKQARNEIEVLSPIFPISRLNKEVQTKTCFYDFEHGFIKEEFVDTCSPDTHFARVCSRCKIIGMGENATQSLTSVSSLHSNCLGCSSIVRTSFASEKKLSRQSIMTDLINFSQTIDSFQNSSLQRENYSGCERRIEPQLEKGQTDTDDMSYAGLDYEETARCTCGNVDTTKADVSNGKLDKSADDEEMMKRFFEKVVIDYYDHFFVSTVSSKLFEILSRSYLHEIIQQSSDEYLLILKNSIDRNIANYLKNQSISFSLEKIFEYVPQYATSAEKLNFIEKFLRTNYPEIFSSSVSTHESKSFSSIQKLLILRITEAFELVDLMRHLRDLSTTVRNIAFYEKCQGENTQVTNSAQSVGEIGFDSARLTVYEYDEQSDCRNLKPIGKIHLSGDTDKLICELIMSTVKNVVSDYGNHGNNDDINQALLPSMGTSAASKKTSAAIMEQDSPLISNNNEISDYRSELQYLKTDNSVQFTSLDETSMKCDDINDNTFVPCMSYDGAQVFVNSKVCDEFSKFRELLEIVVNKTSAIENIMETLKNALEAMGTENVFPLLQVLSHKIDSSELCIRTDLKCIIQKISDMLSFVETNFLQLQSTDQSVRITDLVNTLLPEINVLFEMLLSKKNSTLSADTSERDALKSTINELEIKLQAKDQALTELKSDMCAMQCKLRRNAEQLEEFEATNKQLIKSLSSRIDTKYDEMFVMITNKLENLSVLSSLQTSIEELGSKIEKKADAEKSNAENVSFSIIHEKLQDLCQLSKKQIESNSFMLERFGNINEMNENLKRLQAFISVSDADERTQFFKSQVENAVNTCCERLSTLLYKFSKQLEQKSMTSVQHNVLELYRSEVRKEMSDVNKAINETLKKNITNMTERITQVTSALTKSLALSSHTSTQTSPNINEKIRELRSQKVDAEVQLLTLKTKYDNLLKEREKEQSGRETKKKNDELMKLRKEKDDLQQMVVKLYEKNRLLNEQLTNSQNKSHKKFF